MPYPRLSFISQLFFQFHLLSAHGMWPGMPFYTSRLRRRAELIQAIDAKLAGENIDHLPLSDLTQSLNVRKLNDIGLSEDEKRQLLKQWITLAKSKTTIYNPNRWWNFLFLGNSSSSFILHAIILGSFRWETRLVFIFGNTKMNKFTKIRAYLLRKIAYTWNHTENEFGNLHNTA